MMREKKKLLKNFNQNIMKLGTTTERDTGTYGKLKEIVVGENPKVSFWEKTWGQDYPKLAEGLEIDFDIIEKEKNGYKNFTAYPKKVSTTGTTGGFRGIAVAQETKRNDIKNAQENKELGIKISSTVRLATDVVVAMISNQPVQDESITKNMITRWRKWFWENWDKEESDFEPFPSQ